MSETNVYMYDVNEADGMKHYVSLLPPEGAFARGLRPESIVGVLQRSLNAGERITPEVFARNRLFVDFLHSVVARQAPSQVGLKAEAKRVGDGVVYIIDERTPTPNDAVPPEDIIGAFVVEGGEVVPDSYTANGRHMILSQGGFFQLNHELRACLLSALGAATSDR